MSRPRLPRSPGGIALAPVAAQCTKVQGPQVGGADREHLPSPRSYRRSAEEWDSNAATTQYHARDALCSSASEAAGLLLEDCAAGALGRAAA